MPFPTRALAGRGLIVALCAVAAIAPLHAQATASTSPVRVFLDCGFACDQDFMRTEITYVDWVRDRAASDVHVLVTSQGTGGGGREFTLAFLGQRRFAGIGDTLQFVAAQGSTEDDTRRGVSRTLRLGLVPYLARTALAERLELTLAAPRAGATTAAATPSHDPWNYWVFSLGGNGNFSGEQASSFHSLNGNVNARRTTEMWKLNLEGRHRWNRSTFEVNDEKSSFVRRSTSVNQLAVRSLGPRFSAGLRSSLGSSTFENKRFFYRVTPAVEYDIFPYAESTRRMLTVQYAAGVESFRYYQETAFLRMSETRPLHTLQIDLDQNQPWGSINAEVEGGQYLDETNKNYASISGRTSVRVFKGFSFNVGGHFASIHNQLYIPRAGATPEEIYTQQRQLATTYSYFVFTGLSYTFGSVLNNVVNPRFGRGGGGGGNCVCF